MTGQNTIIQTVITVSRDTAEKMLVRLIAINNTLKKMGIIDNDDYSETKQITDAASQELGLELYETYKEKETA